MNAKRISGALMVSLVIHGIIMLIASIKVHRRVTYAGGDFDHNRRE